MREILKPGDDFVIAGAHRGFLASVAVSLIGPEGKVFAFEPETENYSMLVETTKDFGNVKTFNFALGQKDCKAPLFVNSDNNGGHALWDVGKIIENALSREHPNAYDVDVKFIDGLDEDFSNVKLMLFDVEGAEFAVLKGAINTIVDYEIPFIICEINNTALEMCGANQKMLKSYLTAYGYKIYTLAPGTIKELRADEDIEIFHENDKIVYNVLFIKKRMQ